ncbi:MAG: aromatic ring-hydroxylating dioxygenase subunit alpha [Burkholderiaceae bacterium]|nr:MAG: aromatic ring-hydroxylating dioxygenase subunit alpha [Burkholderiaceae bacterium]TAM00719.1 MAG: aromatic ring-hydroxylating dioxygenase subunit alpha [Pusillimonas sp.]
MLKNYWYVACTSEMLGAKPLGRVICNEPVVIFRQKDGTAAILRNVCPHRQAPLSMGTVHDNALRCAYHGMEFSATGQCIHIPSQDVIPPKAHVRSYPTCERYGFVWIWPGAPELATSAVPPQMPWREDKTWNASIVQYFHVKGSHMLMNDNLLDLSHVAFLHANSIGFDSSRLDNDPLEVVVEDHYIRTQRLFRNTIQAPAHKAWQPLTEPVDRTQRAEWHPPCTVNILARNENTDAQVDLRADHLITPETDETHHYYVAISRNFRIDDVDLTHKLDADARRVHMEDLEIAEAQQSMKPWTHGTPDMALKADKAVTASHRILERLEQAQAPVTL